MAKKKNKPKSNKIPSNSKGINQAINLPKAEFKDLINHKFKALFHSIDNSSIAFFRIFFGIIMTVDILTYIFHEGWVYSFWIADIYHFKFWPLEFIQPLPGIGMYIIFGFMAFCCLCIMLGLFYRIAIGLFFICFTYVFLIEETVYLNHFYLVILVSFIMIFIPASRSYSLDTKIFKKLRTNLCQAWHLWLLRFTIGLPYFFGGLAKMKPDWLQGEPLRTWLSYKTDFPLIGSFFKDEWMILFMSYSGLLLDLLVVPALLYKRTRIYAFVLISIFHLMNSRLFTIGIFPWFMIAATTIFFDPGWFRKIYKKIRKDNLIKKNKQKALYHIKTKLSPLSKKVIVGLFSFWVIIHCLIPLRHFFIPGNVLWTEEGYYFSWHMMLRTKTGTATFTMVNNQTGERKIIVNEDYLPIFQSKKVYINPKLIWEFAQRIEHIYEKLGFDVAIYADVKVSLNGRPFYQLIDPQVDLTEVAHPIYAPVHWILPAPE